MVARDNAPGPGGDTAPHLWLRLFRAWQLALSRVVRPRPVPPSETARVRVLATTVGALHDPGEAAAGATSARARVLALTGVASVAIGAAARAALAGALDRPIGPVLLAIAIGLSWLVARYVVLLLLARGLAAATPVQVLAAWSVGLLPYAAAVGGPMPAAAFAVSAWLTYAALRGASGTPHARTMCLIAYGAEAAGALTSWAVANGLAVIPYLL